MSIRKRKLKSGKIVYVVQEYVGFTTDGKRDRKSITCHSMAEARVEQARLISIKDAKSGRSGRCTFRQYVELWWWPSTSELAASTRDTYEKELRLRLLPAFSHLNIGEITRLSVQHMVDGCKTKRVAQKALGTLKTILNQAVADGLLTTNPASGRFRMPLEGKPRGNTTVITTFEDMKPLLDALRQYREIDDGFCLVLAGLGLLMGLRPEERYGLDWEDLDFINNLCHVQRAYTSVSKREGNHDLKKPKTKLSNRYVPIPVDFAECLRQYANEEKMRGHGPVLLGFNRHRITPATAKGRWDRFCRWAKQNNLAITEVTIENMRHSFATSYLHAGGKVEDLSRMLGHSNISTTYKRYVKPNTEDIRQGVHKFVPHLLD